MNAARGWLVLAGFVVVWDWFTYARDETLSDGAARAMRAHPWLTGAAIVYTGLHLMDVLPAGLDLFSAGGKLAGCLHRYP